MEVPEFNYYGGIFIMLVGFYILCSLLRLFMRDEFVKPWERIASAEKHN